MYIKEVTVLYLTLAHAIVLSLDSLHNTLCMYRYGCELWNLSNGQDKKIKIAWCKVTGRIRKLPRLTHNCSIHGLSTDVSALI